ncbi:peptide ligase PGM1-related protein [Saccharothrix australiensis]|uniref:preATP grasp domain-containing protein n=1 Tax=Saccharothrix australiensis TaxID=2072 RepID=UPI0011C3EB7A|nr:peptide ligase PGM1-related protein [Saccharothrix australiensis]
MVGHDFNEDLRNRNAAAWYSQRLTWFARDGDVLVLPTEPDKAYVEYVTGWTGTSAESLRFVVPPPGEGAIGRLTRERLRDPEFLDRLRAAAEDRVIDHVYALWPDARVVELADALGVGHAVPGRGFLSQGGDAVANSKALFRVIARGVGVPVAEGAVCLHPRAAEQAVTALLDAGHPAMLKNEFMSGGWGNEIISRTPHIDPIGARRLVVVADAITLRDYLEEHWDKLTGDGRHSLVVERYHPDSSAAFAEFHVGDDGVRFGGQGQLLSLPQAASVIPAPNVDAGRMAEIIDGGRRLGEAMRAIGYRGVLSADAIVTPAGEVLFTEYNGRSTGSTHLYGVVGEQVIGPGYAEDRFIVERIGTPPWSVTTFAEAVDRLAGTDLGYDRASRRGVLFVHAFNPAANCVPYCVVAESMDAATEVEQRLGELFDFAPPIA